MRRFLVGLLCLISLALLVLGGLFTVQNSETQVQLFLNLGSLLQKTSGPVAVPQLIGVTAVVGFFLGVLFSTLVRPRRRQLPRRAKQRVSRSEPADDFDL